MYLKRYSNETISLSMSLISNSMHKQTHNHYGPEIMFKGYMKFVRLSLDLNLHSLV